ncbi:hypothetical protein BDZ91DRAFT_733668 [Kalaharituber pfeilii]|nr:hypothetical protein BDZ91DRAFT_733668 [Kalaharituber pfeilii]
MSSTARCSQSAPPDIPSSPNILSKLVHHRSQHSKSKSNSAAEVLAVVWAAGGFTATVVWAAAHSTKCTYATQAIYEPMLLHRGLVRIGLVDGNSLRLPPLLQTRGWKKLSSG